MNILLFLGAGFSVEAGLPTQAKFLKKVNRLKNIGNISLSEYYGVSVGYYLAQYLEEKEDINMEEAFIALDYLYLTKRDDYKLAYLEDIVEKRGFVPSSSGIPIVNARNSFLKVIEKVYSPLAYQEYDNQTLYEKFFKKLLDNYKIAVITTNYDLLCEKALKGIQKNYAHFPVFNENYLTGESYITPLLKLHGSIDWKETPYDTANIVPPTFMKNYDRRGKYSYIWNWAEYAIRYSDVIFFIGYSLPMIDTQVRYLIKIGLQQYKINHGKKKVFVVKPRNNDIKNYDFIKKSKMVKNFEPIYMKFGDFSELDINSLI